MAKVTITVPDSIVTDLEAAFRFHYIGNDTATGAAFVKNRIIEYAQGVFAQYRVTQAMNTASSEASTQAQSDFTAT